MPIVIALLLGAAIGLLLGLLGGGGSILAVPALVYVLGVGIEEAIPMSLIVVGAAALFGALPKIRAGHVQWRLAAIFAAVGIPATFAGAAVGHHLSHKVLLVGFAAVMVFAGVRMLQEKAEAGTACATEGSGINWRRCVPRATGAGALVGLLTGLFGVGGGFLIIPALVILLGVDMPVAVGTSLVIIVANSASGVLSHLSTIAINWGLTAAFVSTAIVGSFLAGNFGRMFDQRRLQRWFAYLVLAVATYVVVDTLLLS